MILKQAGLEEVEEDIVELENLMRVNFLVVADEVELLVAADEEEQDSEKKSWSVDDTLYPLA